MQRLPNNRNGHPHRSRATFFTGAPTLSLEQDGERAEAMEGRVQLVGEEGLTFDYELEIRIDEESAAPRMVCNQLTAIRREGGPPVTSRQLARETGKAMWKAVSMLSWYVSDGDGVRIGNPAPSFVRSAMKGGSTGRPRVPADEIGHAARIYLEALRAGRPTTAAVAAGLNVSASTARKRVLAARRAGFLPPAKSTRPRL